MQISPNCTDIPPSWTSFHTSHQRAPGWAPRTTQQLPTSSASDVVVYTCQCRFLSSPHALLPPLCPQVHSLHLCLYSFPEDRFISTIFSGSRLYVLIYNICFSLSDFISFCIRGSRFSHLTTADSDGDVYF